MRDVGFWAVWCGGVMAKMPQRQKATLPINPVKVDIN